MGAQLVYLQQPVTEKELVDGGDLHAHGTSYGVCEMQGWRRNMEDAHLAETELDKNVSLFGVFDGHGGRGVSRFAAAKLAGILRETDEYKKGEYARALEKAFLTIDERLRAPDGRKEIERLDKADGSTVSHPMAVPRRVLERFLGTGKKNEKETDDMENVDNEIPADSAAETIRTEEPTASSGEDVTKLEETAEDASGGDKENETPQEETEQIKIAEDDDDEDAEVLLDEDLDDFDEDIDDGEDMALVDPAQLTRDPTPEAQGCTAVVVLLIRDEGGKGSRIFCANAGDSRAIMSRKGVVLPLSEDHKPENESETSRIKAAGGYVQHMPGGARVQGDLNLSRAFGDLRYKKPADKPPEEQILTAFPEVRSFDLTDDDEFMVIGCDGIWERKQNQEMIDFVRPKICSKEGNGKVRAHSSVCGEICDTGLCPSMDPNENEAFDGTGCDNMTVMVVQLKQDCGDCQTKRQEDDTEKSAGDDEQVREAKRQKLDEAISTS